MASTRPPGTYSPSARTGRSGGGAGGVAGMVRHAGPDALPTVPVDSWAASIRRWSRPDTAFRGCFDIGNPLQHNPRPRGPGRTGCAHGSVVQHRSATGRTACACEPHSTYRHTRTKPVHHFADFLTPYPLTKGRGDVDFGARVADATALRRLDAEGDGRHRAVAPRPGPRFRNPSRGCRCTSATPRWRRSAPLGLEEDTDPPLPRTCGGRDCASDVYGMIMARAARVAADNFIGIPLNGRARIGGGTGSGFREVAAALAAGEGTAWLWARTEMAGAVDVLVIVEAGQMSRANPSSGSPARRRRLPLAHLLGECVAARDSRVARRRGRLGRTPRGVAWSSGAP